MLDLPEFLLQPEPATTFIKDLKAGKISMNWEEILADDEKLENLQELTFGLLMQAADNAQSLQPEKLPAVLGKIFILNKAIDNAAAEENREKLPAVCKELEPAIREFANLINVEEIAKSITALSESDDDTILEANLQTAFPLVSLVLGLRMLVSAHEIADLDQDSDDEDHEEEGCCE